jgi:hypothetical protein
MHGSVHALRVALDRSATADAAITLGQKRALLQARWRRITRGCKT